MQFLIYILTNLIRKREPLALPDFFTIFLGQNGYTTTNHNQFHLASEVMLDVENKTNGVSAGVVFPPLEISAIKAENR